jgi:hypothetical protein
MEEDPDNLETLAELSGQSIWRIFKEIAKHNRWSQRRVDHLWDAWVWEDFINPEMDYELALLIQKVTWPERSLS